jgi:DNA-binding SARP family transcriptional activator
MPLLHLSVCGVPLVTREPDGMILNLSPRRLLFLTYLAAQAPHGATRDRVLATFWPDSTSEDGRNALKQLVFALRRNCGGPLLHSTNTIRLLPGAITCDLWEVRDAMRRRDSAAVTSLVRGPVLEGVNEWQSPALDQWLTGLRATVASWHAAAASEGDDRSFGAVSSGL